MAIRPWLSVPHLAIRHSTQRTSSATSVSYSVPSVPDKLPTCPNCARSLIVLPLKCAHETAQGRGGLTRRRGDPPGRKDLEMYWQPLPCSVRLLPCSECTHVALVSALQLQRTSTSRAHLLCR